MMYALYGLLEVVFTVLWLPFGVGNYCLYPLTKWAYKKRFNIWAEAAGQAILQNKKDVDAMFKRAKG